MKKISYILALMIISISGIGQEKLAPLIKPEIDKSQVMFKRFVWRRMDMMEKQNLPFFSLNGEVPRLLIQAVNEGLINPYRSDSCINFMPDIIFSSNISVEQEQNPFVSGGFNSNGFDDSFGDDQNNDQESNTSSAQPKLLAIPPEEFSVLYIKEEVIFDRNRSRMYYFIRSLTIALPADAGTTYNPAGFEKQIAHFKYDEVVDLFRGPYVDKAIHYNNQNLRSAINLSDAFELRLFNAPIIKISNPQNLDIRQIYADEMAEDPLSVIGIQQKYEYDLMDYESELWEY